MADLKLRNFSVFSNLPSTFEPILYPDKNTEKKFQQYPTPRKSSNTGKKFQQYPTLGIHTISNIHWQTTRSKIIPRTLTQSIINYQLFRYSSLNVRKYRKRITKLEIFLTHPIYFLSSRHPFVRLTDPRNWLVIETGLQQPFHWGNFSLICHQILRQTVEYIRKKNETQFLVKI